MVDTMLSNLDLSEGFWGEAIQATCYILIQVPNKRHITTPYEFWNKRKPNLDYFKVWGRRAIVRVHESKKRKLKERKRECIFITRTW